MIKWLLLPCCMFFMGVGVCFSQSIRWASEVKWVDNEYDSLEYSSMQLIGPPDVENLGELSPKAYRLKAYAGRSKLKLAFSKASPVQQIFFVESHLPGRITEVALEDTAGNHYKIYQKKSEELSFSCRLLVLEMPKTAFAVSGLDIVVDTYLTPGWSQLDAVGVANISGKEELKNVVQSFDMPIKKVVIPGKERLGNQINIDHFIQTKPVVSPDGRTLYFARKYRTPYGLFRRSRLTQDIYYSELKDGEWQEANKMGDPLNNKYPNGVCAVANGGQTLLLLGEYKKNGKMSGGVSVSQKTASGWSKPVKVHIQNFYNDSYYADFTLSSNGKVMIMALDRYDSQGDQDLYVSFSIGGYYWSEPKSLGKVINTSGAEYAPFLASDGKTLYFSSNGHDGFGGSDCFVSRRLDETWDNWSEPENLGPAINSTHWDACYWVSDEGNYAYMVSSEEKKESVQGIYKVYLPENYLPEPVIKFSGKIIDAETGTLVPAHIVLESLDNSKEVFNLSYLPSQDSLFSIALASDRAYSVSIRGKGFFTFDAHISHQDIEESKHVEKNYYLEPVREGVSFYLTDVYFKQSRADLLSESFKELDGLVLFLKENPTVEIELGGHTDSQGKSSLNYILSEKRANTVKDYLVHMGIRSRRVSVKAYGDTRPVERSEDEQGRKLNRRVSVTVIKQ
jgi:outer membrane protein OmpA-like peptidoglycan-associated protein